MSATAQCPVCEFKNPAGQTACRRCGTPLPTSGPAGGTGGGHRIKQGQVLANRYYVIAEIGRGGMGSIYRVKDNTLKEEVALKTLLPQFVQDKHVVERFFNEARIARQLSHPNIVRVHDIGASQGTVYISMELLGGKSLRQELEDLMPGDRIPIDNVLKMFDQLCAALEYAHRYTVHRDLKPENVMVMDDGNVKLMDFGISKLMGDTRLTSASMVMGTPHYMSPEQVQNSAGVDARADIYSLGVMLYESLTGQLPAALKKPVSQISRSIPPAFDRIIETCLQENPNKRYQTMGELRDALRAVARQMGVGGELRSQPRRREMPALPTRLIAGVTLVALCLGGMVFGLWRAEATRKQVIETFRAPPPPIPSPVPPIAEETPVVQAPPTMTWDDMLRDVPRALRLAEQAAKRTTSTLEREYRMAIVQTARQHWAGAVKNKRTPDRLERSMNSGWQALHRGLAVIAWPSGMIFVPPEGDPAKGGGGFFIDAQPVTVSDFATFADAHDWRWPKSARRLEDTDPMVGITHYDAAAYLAVQQPPRRLPTTEEWARATEPARVSERMLMLGAEDTLPTEVSAAKMEKRANPDRRDVVIPLWTPPYWIADGLEEWTGTVAGEPEAAPDFGETVEVLGFTRDNQGRWRVLPEGRRRYGESSTAVGFRGVYALPTHPAAVADILN